MLVNHGRRVACLRGGQVFIGMRSEMVGAKGVAQPVGFAVDLRFLAQFNKTLLEGDFVQSPQLAAGPLAENFKLSGQGGTNFYKPASAGLALSSSNLDVARHSPNV
ncbi:MAG: hypothetical protein JWQ04_1131 [Pedosphaera sp.]|nr:hypothetical protein [Pedosphaera sp.]